MVALSPRFAVLAAFISLASFSTSPLPVGAAVIPRAEEIVYTARSFAGLQNAFRYSQVKAMKRYDQCSKDACPDICGYLLNLKLGKRAQHSSPHWSLGKHGDSYAVSHSAKHSHSYEHQRYSRDIVARESRSENGNIAIVTPQNGNLGFLTVKKDEKNPHPKSLPVQATQSDPTSFMLVRESPRESDAKGLQVVSLQLISPDRSETGIWCAGYNAFQSQNRNLFVSSCENSGPSQRFAYNETSRDISPLSYAPQTDSAQSVLSGTDGRDKREETQATVYLKFEPIENAKAEDMADVDDVAADVPNGSGSSIATMTKTVTVTNAPTASLSAADSGATPNASASSSTSTSPTSSTDGAVPSANVSSSAATSSTVTNGATQSANASPSASLTSTTNGAAPTAGAPGTAGAASVLGVEVVQASSAPSAATSTNASSVSAVPTSTRNPQDIAASIASSSAATSPTPSGSSVAASSSSTSTASSTSAGSSAPSARA